jgi:hypothetical protein
MGGLLIIDPKVQLPWAARRSSLATDRDRERRRSSAKVTRDLEGDGLPPATKVETKLEMSPECYLSLQTRPGRSGTARTSN